MKGLKMKGEIEGVMMMEDNKENEEVKDEVVGFLMKEKD